MKLYRLGVYLIGLVLLPMFSCEDGDPDTMDTAPALSSEKAITGFSIDEIEGTINQTENTINLALAETDFAALTPTITISDKATISPDSGVEQNFTDPVTYTVTAEDGTEATYVVTVTSTITSFIYGETTYEIVSSRLTWVEAAAFAVSRGGELARINDEDEQNALFEALGNASINVDNTVAPDGGGASYVWIGGSDLVTEGDWIWDGDNDETGDQFWLGLQDGSPVGELYNNWGMEPDDFGSGQDALGLALTDWPLGLAGQWNDIDHTNELYFLIELN